MYMKADYRRVLIILALIVYGAEPLLLAQSFALTSNKDFGSERMLYMDNSAYPMVSLDAERVRVMYGCELGFVDRSREKIRMNCVLQIGTRHTKYMSEQRYLVDSLFYTGKSSLMARTTIYNQKANFLLAEDCYYKDLNAGMMVFTGRLAADDFLYEEKIPVLNWDLKANTKEICGHHCRMAETEFRGRKYTAWYAEDIPTPAGPWKFQGLPGLILEVVDSDRVVRMSAQEIWAGNGTIVKTEYPYVKVKRLQYQALRRQMLDDPVIFSMNHSSRSKWEITPPARHVPAHLPLLNFLEKD